MSHLSSPSYNFPSVPLRMCSVLRCCVQVSAVSVPLPSGLSISEAESKSGWLQLERSPLLHEGRREGGESFADRADLTWPPPHSLLARVCWKKAILLGSNRSGSGTAFIRKVSPAPRAAGPLEPVQPEVGNEPELLRPAGGCERQKGNSSSRRLRVLKRSLMLSSQLEFLQFF